MNRFKTAGVGLLAALIVAVSSGCVVIIFAAGAAAGVGGAVWYRGELRTSLAGSVPKVRDAASAVLEKMGRGVTVEGEGSVMGATLTSYSEDNRKITIELKYLSTEVTEIHIRVGFWGDETYSRSLLVQINERLGKSSAAAPALSPAPA